MTGSQGFSVLCEENALQISEVVIHMVTLHFYMYYCCISVFIMVLITFIMFSYITL